MGLRIRAALPGQCSDPKTASNIGIGSRGVEMSYRCPCCGHLTLGEEGADTFEICPVCFWEDDNVQNENPDYEGGANGISLNEAKKNYRKFGAIKEELIKHVRRPTPREFNVVK